MDSVSRQRLEVFKRSHPDAAGSLDAWYTVVEERLVNRLKQFRRIATRYEKRAVYDLGMLTNAAIVLWL